MATDHRAPPLPAGRELLSLTTPPASPAPVTPAPGVASTPALDLARRDRLARRIRLFAAATITYNVIEAVVAITTGTRASSTALISFGLDSVIEVASAVALSWQFAARDHDVREAREARALRVIALSFFALAAYVGIDAVRGLLGDHRAGQSLLGIVLAAISLAVMPTLSWGQRRAGRQLASASAVADSHQTLLCTYLSAVLLVGLVLNAVAGWWWADPLAALVIAVVAVKEGREAWEGEGCCAPTSSGGYLHDGDRTHAATTGCGCGGACGC